MLLQEAKNSPDKLVEKLSGSISSDGLKYLTKRCFLHTRLPKHHLSEKLSDDTLRIFIFLVETFIFNISSCVGLQNLAIIGMMDDLIKQCQQQLLSIDETQEKAVLTAALERYHLHRKKISPVDGKESVVIAISAPATAADMVR